MKTFLKILFSTILLSCSTTQTKPKLARQPKSFIYLPDKKAFCRSKGTEVVCVHNGGLIAYPFADNTMLLKYILNLNKSCK